ncbi:MULTISPECIES: c-type cytochrome [unclassified Roseovarius]|uniref:c-type cytochrome n=1 Tax=unclassified Roseovarius TaxID=2614913 RepID=UPI002740173F|nr:MULTISPECIES: cytochrome c [unclassified Roseovarius]
MRRLTGIGLAGLTVAVIGGVVLAQSSSETAALEGLTFLGEPVAEADLEAGERVYAESCASCHGENLEGQPDWRRRLDNGRMPAPPHDETGHTWHHSDRNLFIVTKGGVQAVVPGYESDMPAFEGILTDDEIADVLAYIKSTWPERQREFQAEVSANDKGEL